MIIKICSCLGFENRCHRQTRARRKLLTGNISIAMSSICHCATVRIILTQKWGYLERYRHIQTDRRWQRRRSGRETIVSGFGDIGRQQSGAGFIIKAFPSRRRESAVCSHSVERAMGVQPRSAPPSGPTPPHSGDGRVGCGLTCLWTPDSYCWLDANRRKDTGGQDIIKWTIPQSLPWCATVPALYIMAVAIEY